jgi:hypothetical protein
MVGRLVAQDGHAEPTSCDLRDSREQRVHGSTAASQARAALRARPCGVAQSTRRSRRIASPSCRCTSEPSDGVAAWLNSSLGGRSTATDAHAMRRLCAGHAQVMHASERFVHDFR